MYSVTCPYCGKELFDERNLPEHIRIDHKEKVKDNGIISFKCDNTKQLADRLS